VLAETGLKTRAVGVASRVFQPHVRAANALQSVVSLANRGFIIRRVSAHHCPRGALVIVRRPVVRVCDVPACRVVCAREVNISFDDEGRVRVLDAQKFKQTEALEAECSVFVQSVCCGNCRCAACC
jgi:hypothetical protein